MSTDDLERAVAKHTQVPRTVVKRVVRGLIEVVTQALLAGDRVSFSRFGIFELRTRASRSVVNPRTRQRTQVPPSVTVGFKTATALKNRINQMSDGEQPSN